jgi:hypothetical protein
MEAKGTAQNSIRLPANAAQANGHPGAEVVQAIVDAIGSVRFGEITIIVQDGLVVQVNRLEKRRLR